MSGPVPAPEAPQPAQSPPAGTEPEKTSDERVTPKNLLVAVAVVLVIQAFSLLVTQQNLPVYVQIVNSTGPPYNPSGAPSSSYLGAILNALILVALVAVLTFSLLFLLKKRKVNVFRLIVFGSVSISSFVLTLTTADVLAVNAINDGYIPAYTELPIAFGAASLVVVLVGYIIFVKNRLWLSTALLAFVGAEVGSFFAETLTAYTALAIVAAFSVYDIYAVFKGPLKSMIGTAPGVALVGMSIKAGEFTLGLGDVVFYTLLPSLAYFDIGLTAALGVMLAIDAGVIVTLYLLSKKRLLPGLPIPMLLGMLTFLAFSL